MVRDITYCASKNCEYMNVCKRHFNNNKFDPWDLIWQSNFNNDSGEGCDYKEE